MKFKNTKVMNFKEAFHGLRNPLESWEKSDSAFGIADINYCDWDWAVADDYCKKNEIDVLDGDLYDAEQEKYAAWLRENGILRYESECIEYAFIGPNDLDLAHRMIKAGTSDSKFLRQIFISVNITAPLYWY